MALGDDDADDSSRWLPARPPQRLAVDPGLWVPLGDKRQGMIAVAVAATVSLVFLASLLAYIATLLWRYRARSRAGRVEKETRALRFLASSHGVAFISLLAGDLCQALGFSLTYHWLIKGGVPAPAHPTHVCIAQAVLIQVGDIGSAFSSIIICANLFVIIVLKLQPSLRVLLSAIALAWLCSGAFASAGPARYPPQPGRLPFYGNVGGWCWITAAYQSERLTLHYLWVFVTAAVTCLLYTVIATRIWWQRRQLGPDASLSTGTASVAKVMLVYPGTYVATILPLSVYRCAAMAGQQWSIQIALAAGAIFTLSGAADCTVYALTRHIVSLDGIGSALRRGSGSGSFGRSLDVRRLSVFTSHRPSLDPSQASVQPPQRPTRLARLRAFFRHDAAERPVPSPSISNPKSSPTLAVVAHARVVEADGAAPPAGEGDASAGPALRDVQWGAADTGEPRAPGARRLSVTVSPLERSERPFAHLDAVERGEVTGGHRADGPTEELKPVGEVEEREQVDVAEGGEQSGERDRVQPL